MKREQDALVDTTGDWRIKQSTPRDPYFDKISSETAYREAADDNLDVVLPEPYDLFIDIDGEEDMKRFDRGMDVMIQQFNAQVIKSTPSRSGLPKRHLIVRLNRQVTNAERIALQAALGSDPVREILGIVRVQHNDPHPTLFLENKCSKTQSENSNTTMPSKSDSTTRATESETESTTLP